MLEAVNPSPHQRGLTLVELMIGLAFLGVLLAVAAPSLQGMVTAQRMRSAASELVTDIQFARSEAVRLNRPVIMAFGPDAVSACYTLYIRGVAGFCQCTRGVGNACLGGPTELKTRGLPASQGITLNGISAADTRDVTFDAQQGLPNTERFTIDIASPAGSLRTLINPAGSISQCSPDGRVSGVARC